MFRIHSFCLKLGALLALLFQYSPANGRDRIDQPMFSSKAITIYQGKRIDSPDHKKTVAVESLKERLSDSPGDFPARLTLDTEEGKLTATFGFSLDAELLWSPDSNAFALTGSVRGANGQYKTDVFLIQDKSLVVIHLTELIEGEFGHSVKCDWPESPNV